MLTFALFWLQLATKTGSSESLQQLVEILRNPGANATVLGGVSAGKEDKGNQSKDKKVLVNARTLSSCYNVIVTVSVQQCAFLFV